MSQFDRQHTHAGLGGDVAVFICAFESNHRETTLYHCLFICLCLSGANVNMKDRCGCNFLHLTIFQPKALKNLPEEVLQVTSINAACLRLVKRTALYAA